MNKTHNNNQLTIKELNKEVTLVGWVAKTRDLGGLLFIDLRDKEGITQVVVKPDHKQYKLACSIKNEYVIKVTGKVIKRESINKKITTGEIEVDVKEIEIYSKSKQTPIYISDKDDSLENTRLKYRYLDLRRPSMQNNIITRHKATMAVRNYLNDNDFLEIETPIFSKSTPEGARDYLVPSRVHNGEFYALPQSPQIYKQLFMISGFEKYYQITKCFRDEDLRSDRQPEFTQIDIETSFLSQEDIINFTEEMLIKVWKDVLNIKLNKSFPKITYKEAMATYGSDKPDTRFDMKLVNVKDIFKSSEFAVFKNAEDINCIVLKNQADKVSRKVIDKLTEFVKKYKANGLAYLKYTDNEINGPIKKFLSEKEITSLTKETNFSNNDIVFFVADKKKVSQNALGALRVHLANEYDLIDKSLYNFLWVVDWPLFEYDEETDRYYAAHHPFTAPKEDNKELLETNPDECIAAAYDIVCNGYELGGGSIRIHNNELQTKMFNTLGFSTEEAIEQFGFFIEALQYGTPPHGGIALGLDRLVMLLLKTNNIKDVIAFPKTASARCLMTEAPSKVSEDQLKELGIKFNE